MQIIPGDIATYRESRSLPQGAIVGERIRADYGRAYAGSVVDQPEHISDGLEEASRPGVCAASADQHCQVCINACGATCIALPTLARAVLHTLVRRFVLKETSELASWTKRHIMIRRSALSAAALQRFVRIRQFISMRPCALLVVWTLLKRLHDEHGRARRDYREVRFLWSMPGQLPLCGAIADQSQIFQANSGYQ